MKVKEAIRYLSQFPEDWDVLLGTDDGFASAISLVDAQPTVHMTPEEASKSGFEYRAAVAYEEKSGAYVKAVWVISQEDTQDD